TGLELQDVRAGLHLGRRREGASGSEGLVVGGRNGPGTGVLDLLGHGRGAAAHARGFEATWISTGRGLSPARVPDRVRRRKSSSPGHPSQPTTPETALEVTGPSPVVVWPTPSSPTSSQASPPAVTKVTSIDSASGSSGMPSA